MKKPGSMKSLEDLGRVRLSKNFFLRDFLHSEIAEFYRIPNIPDDPELAIEAGRKLCEELLEPLEATFGRLHIRSAYRNRAVNAFGNANSSTARPMRQRQPTISGTCAMRRAAWGPPPASPFPGSGTGSVTKAAGKAWRGGFTTTFPTPRSASFPSSGPSTSSGTRGRGAESAAMPSRAGC